MLRVEHFSNDILTDISFHLRDDENLIILGANGAGKSTLAKVLCGIIPSEKVTLFSQKFFHLSAKKRARIINYVPAKLEMFDEYITLKEYLELSILHSSMQVDEVMKLLALSELKNKVCKRLSSGEQQLTMLASALLHGAKLTIFDEPTANLDPQKTVKVYEILKSELIGQRVIITHDLNLAYKLGYKILYIQEGKVAFFDANEKFFESENLGHFFGKNIICVDGHYMVNL